MGAHGNQFSVCSILNELQLNGALGCVECRPLVVREADRRFHFAVIPSKRIVSLFLMWFTVPLCFILALTVQNLKLCLRVVQLCSLVPSADFLICSHLCLLIQLLIFVPVSAGCAARIRGWFSQCRGLRAVYAAFYPFLFRALMISTLKHLLRLFSWFSSTRLALRCFCRYCARFLTT